MEMTRRQRVMAALRGEAVDRVPFTLWAHNFRLENTAQDLCDESVRLFERFDLDLLKPQSRAQCFGEAWGLTYQPSQVRTVRYELTYLPPRGAAELAQLEPADPTAGALGEQLEALALIRARVGPDVPIIWTVFSPLMLTRYLLAGGQDELLELARQEPQALERGLQAIAETMAGYARAAVAGGADGLFYATTLASRGQLSAEELRRFQRPFDQQVLGAVRDAPFNVMHVCGEGILFDEFLDYPVAAYSWAMDPANPSLAEGHRRTGRACLGGFPRNPAALPDAAALQERVRQAIAQLDGRWLLLGPDCSVDPSTPDQLLDAALEAARGGRAG